MSRNLWKEEGKAETLLGLLERRFGAVPEDAGTRILDTLVGDRDAWLDAFACASNLDDVLGNGANLNGAETRPIPTAQGPQTGWTVVPGRLPDPRSISNR